MDNLVQVTEVLRGLDTLRPVEREFPTRAETIAYLTEVFKQDPPSRPKPSGWGRSTRRSGCCLETLI